MDFLFIAGDPALDFVNTEIVWEGQPVDLLDEPQALARWLTEAKLARTREVRVTPEVLAEAKRIRAALREIAGSLADGKPLRRPALALLDGQLRRAPGSLALRFDEGKFSVEFEPDAKRADDPRFLLARAAATFLASVDPARIRRCEGTNCILFFIDTTRSRTRRWCSMAACGNRMKAALHYQRTRKQPGR